MNVLVRICQLPRGIPRGSCASSLKATSFPLYWKFRLNPSTKLYYAPNGKSFSGDNGKLYSGSHNETHKEVYIPYIECWYPKDIALENIIEIIEVKILPSEKSAEIKKKLYDILEEGYKKRKQRS